MLASVSDLQEAKIALQEHVDIIDLKDASRGVLGAVEAEVALEVVAFVAGRCLVSATVGDLPMQGRLIAEAISTMASTGIDIVKVGVFGELTDEVLTLFKQQADRSALGINGRQCSIVVVFFADRMVDMSCLLELAQAGIKGVMLDTADKHNGGLRTHMDDEALGAFVRQAKSHGLMTGLAGALGPDDVLPLLGLAPDYLGFRGALCEYNRRTLTLDRVAVRELRALMNNAPSGYAVQM